jgi:hypothetical protein
VTSDYFYKVRGLKEGEVGQIIYVHHLDQTCCVSFSETQAWHLEPDDLRPATKLEKYLKTEVK